MVNDHQRWQMLALVGLAELLAMTPWFSATAVAGELAREYGFGGAWGAWVTMAVQGGFVLGTLLSALLNLSDVVSARWVFAAGCLGASGATLMTTWAATPGETLAWRAATGAALALVYPPGMKIIAGWFRTGRGLAMGILICCLTLGKAVPYLLAAVPHSSWRTTLHLVAFLCLAAGALVILVVRDGPHVAVTAPFDPAAVTRVFARRATRLGVLGYLGHMWELYAMWAWVGVWVSAALLSTATPGVAWKGPAAAGVAIAAGAAGSLLAGRLADQYGQARVAAWALMVSATCCVLTVPAFGAPFPVLLLLVAVWGFAVVADSAQFSVIVSQTADPEHVGTALTLQTCLGFLLTMGSIRLAETAAATWGWQWAFLVLVPGPVLGVVAMLKLLQPPDISAD